jgi:hypothetical protein
MILLQQRRAFQLGDRVRRNRVGSYPHDVVGAPEARCKIERHEFLRQGRLTAAHKLNKRIDPPAEVLADFLCPRRITRPLALHIAGIEKGPACAILRSETRSQNLGEKAEAAPPPEIDLPQPRAPGVEPLGEEQVLFVLGENVIEAITVRRDRDRCAQRAVGQNNRLLVRGQDPQGQS